MIPPRNSSLAFWGKASPVDGQVVRSHPLIAHALDVAAVAMCLARRCPIDASPETVAFLISLHDLGKFSRPFQGKDIGAWPVAALGPPPTPPDWPDVRHDVVGLALLMHKDLGGIFRTVIPDWKRSDQSWIWTALTGHHGRPPSDHDTIWVNTRVANKACIAAAAEFIRSMVEVFQPPALPHPGTDIDVRRFSWWLAGLTILADWVGSRQAWFPYQPPDMVSDPAHYYNTVALPLARQAIRSAGLNVSAPSPFQGVHGLFPAIRDLTPVQCWAEQVDLSSGPILAVIEDLTGSGKTEAALTLAHRLMATGRADGLYFALPTMATANAMFGRMADAYRALFATDANPSLALAHRRAGLDERFRGSIDAGKTGSSDAIDPADETAESHCASWLAEDRRRTMLAQIGVGTIDQALLAVLPVRHAPLRLFGLAGKVLIVDEAHAYDAYMHQELQTLLQFHAALGGSAILLSATLTHQQRKTLVGAFQAGLHESRALPLTETSYPLATLAGADHVSETPCAPRVGLPRTVRVTRIPDANAAVDRIMCAPADAAVVWIRNTVDDVLNAAATLRARGLTPLVFHARFAMADRLRIEAEVLHRFGRLGLDDRAGVLIATQVVEQSLDIDFDLMISDLAPVDLLIQRAGRLWRHPGRHRPMEQAELLVVSPKPIADPEPNWIRSLLPGTGAVYQDTALLWRSARVLFEAGEIMTPDHMRPMIEAAYDRDDVPPGLADAANDAQGKTFSEAGQARLNVLTLHAGYHANAGAWEPDTRTPTRLESEPSVTLRLALVRDGRIVPYAGDPDIRRAWALSEVSVARRRVAACPLPDALQAAGDRAKADWGRWEREAESVVLAVLEPDGERFQLVGRTVDGYATLSIYDSLLGFQWETGKPT